MTTPSGELTGLKATRPMAPRNRLLTEWRGYAERIEAFATDLVAQIDLDCVEAYHKALADLATAAGREGQLRGALAKIEYVTPSTVEQTAGWDSLTPISALLWVHRVAATALGAAEEGVPPTAIGAATLASPEGSEWDDHGAVPAQEAAQGPHESVVAVVTPSEEQVRPGSEEAASGTSDVPLTSCSVASTLEEALGGEVETAPPAAVEASGRLREACVPRWSANDIFDAWNALFPGNDGHDVALLVATLEEAFPPPRSTETRGGDRHGRHPGPRLEIEWASAGTEEDHRLMDALSGFAMTALDSHDPSCAGVLSCAPSPEEGTTEPLSGEEIANWRGWLKDPHSTPTMRKRSVARAIATIDAEAAEAERLRGERDVERARREAAAGIATGHVEYAERLAADCEARREFDSAERWQDRADAMQEVLEALVEPDPAGGGQEG